MSHPTNEPIRMQLHPFVTRHVFQQTLHVQVMIDDAQVAGILFIPEQEGRVFQSVLQAPPTPSKDDPAGQEKTHQH